MGALLAFVTIAFLFVLYWCGKYFDILWDTLLFRELYTSEDKIVTLAVWLFVLGAISCVPLWIYFGIGD